MLQVEVNVLERLVDLSVDLLEERLILGVPSTCSTTHRQQRRENPSTSKLTLSGALDAVAYSNSLTIAELLLVNLSNSRVSVVCEVRHGE